MKLLVVVTPPFVYQEQYKQKSLFLDSNNAGDNILDAFGWLYSYIKTAHQPYSILSVTIQWIFFPSIHNC